MSQWAWCDEEDRRLDYLDHAAQVLYLRVLRRNMDFGSCIVGKSVRLSYAKLIEWTEVRPERGSGKPVSKFSVGKVRALLSMLERAGLIERVRENGEVLPLVFKLVFACTPQLRPNEEQQLERQQNSLGATAVSKVDADLIERLFSSKNSDGCGDSLAVDNLNNLRKKRRMNNSKIANEQQLEQQTSGVVSLSINNNITMRARGNGCAIANDWLPSAEIVKRLVGQFDLPPGFLLAKSIEFKILWRDSCQIADNWDLYFFGACRKKVMARDGEFLSAIQQKKQSEVSHES